MRDVPINGLRKTRASYERSTSDQVSPSKLRKCVEVITTCVLRRKTYIDNLRDSKERMIRPSKSYEWMALLN